MAKKLYSFYIYLIRAIVVIAILVALGFLVSEAILRKIAPNYLIDWSGEVAIYLTSWAILLLGGILVTENEHITADLFDKITPPKFRSIFDLIVNLLGIIFSGTVAYYAREVVSFAIELDEISDSSLQFPKALFYSSLLCGMGLIFLHYLFNIYFLIRSKFNA